MIFKFMCVRSHWIHYFWQYSVGKRHQISGIWAANRFFKKGVNITILFLEAKPPARALPSEVFAAASGLLRGKPHRVQETALTGNQQT